MTTVWVRADGRSDDGYATLLRAVALADAARRREGSVPSVRCVTVLDVDSVALLDDHGVEVHPIASADDHTWIGQIEPGDAVVAVDPPDRSDVLAAAGDVGARTAAVLHGDVEVAGADLLVKPLADPAAAADGVLTGPSAALVRGEFLEFRRERDTLFDTLLIACQRGAADPTAEVVGALGGACRLVVDAPAGLDLEPPADVEIVTHAPSIGALFDRGHVAVTTPDGPIFELLALGLPTAVLRTGSEPPPAIAAAIADGALVDAGDAAADLMGVIVRLIDPGERRRLSRSALELVDGLGADRLLGALLD